MLQSLSSVWKYSKDALEVGEKKAKIICKSNYKSCDYIYMLRICGWFCRDSDMILLNKFRMNKVRKEKLRFQQNQDHETSQVKEIRKKRGCNSEPSNIKIKVSRVILLNQNQRVQEHRSTITKKHKYRMEKWKFKSEYEPTWSTFV